MGVVVAYHKTTKNFSFSLQIMHGGELFFSCVLVLFFGGGFGVDGGASLLLVFFSWVAFLLGGKYPTQSLDLVCVEHPIDDGTPISTQERVALVCNI